MELYAMAAVVLIFGGSIVGVFWTKTAGFGRYTTSVLVLVLVLFVAALAFLLNRVESQPIMNLLFAIAGYAGGLIVGKGGAAQSGK